MLEISGEDTGGSQIQSYDLQFKQDGASEFISIVGAETNNLQRLISQGNLQTDMVYIFRYRVKTKYGWSDSFSPELSGRTATTPSMIQQMTFQIIDQLNTLNQVNVRLEWVQPYNGGSVVTSYRIQFRKHDSDEYASLGDYCDGSNPEVVSQLYCNVPFSVLREEPLNLEYDDLVQAQILAVNEIGSGPWCEANIVGVKIQTEP